MVRKLILMALIVGLVAPAVFAEGQRETGQVPAFDQNRTYNLTFGTYGDLEAAYAKVFASDHFKSLYPNINVTFQTADFGGHHDRLVTQLAAGERTNDVESLEVAFIAQFVEQGDALVDMNQAPYNAGTVSGDVVDFAVAQGTTRAGELVAMPVDIAPTVLFYRADLAAARGADFTNLDSWDEFIAEGRKVSGGGRYAIPHANDVASIPLAGGRGGWYSEDGGLLEPRERFMAALDLVLKVRNAGIDGDLGAWSGSWINSFSDGSVVTMPMGAWFGGALRTWMAPDVTDWRVTYLPGRALSSGGGTFLSIPATVPPANRAAAWELIKYLTTTQEAQIMTFETIDAFPALATTFDHPIMSEPLPYFGNEPVREIFADVALNMPSLIVTEYDNLIQSIWGTVVGEVLEGDLTPDEAYEKALRQIQSVID